MATPQTERLHERTRSPRFLRIWLIVLLSLFLAAAYGYYQYHLNQESFLNTNYFRILSESASRSNENILQLKDLHKFNESESMIRSIFPSYVIGDPTSDNSSAPDVTPGLNNQYDYKFDGQQFWINTGNNVGKFASVAATDILARPTNGFMLYLFVDEQNKVVSSTGDQSILSVVDVSHISRAIAEKQNLNWMDLASENSKPDNIEDKSLPGYSHYIDLQLTSADYRLFIYPLRLASKVTLLHSGTATDHLYLIGVLPKSSLKAQDNQRWNLSLLSIVLILLLFLWMMLRMFMLSNNQPVGDMFYRATMFCSYMLFVMMIAILIAFGEKTLEQQFKASKAELWIDNLNQKMTVELQQIFAEMNDYRNYYRHLLTQRQQALQDHNDTEIAQLETAIFKFPLDSESSKISGYSDKSGSFNWPGNSIQLTQLTLNEDLNQINLFTRGAKLSGQSTYSMWFDPAQDFDGPSHILNALLLDNKGNQILPMIYSIESNKKPQPYKLGHREYFKKVRDQQGWQATFDQQTSGHSNFYLQRLRNIGSGTRGTTLAMPLVEKSSDVPYQHNYIVAADIALASLTMTEICNKNELLDISFMVIDRDSGEVLFHQDDDRTLIENLFEFGQGTEDISHRIRAGLDGPSNAPLQWVDGFYHGVAGQFSFKATPIQQWALVVFMPDESLDTYMTNLFLLNTISMASTLLIIAFAIILLRKLEWTFKIKNLLGIPQVIERRKIMVFSSVFVAVVFLGFWVGAAIDLNRSSADTAQPAFYMLASYWLPLMLALICLLWGYREYSRFYMLSRQALRSPINIAQGVQIMCLLYLLLGGLIYGYLSKVAMASSSALRWYYTQNVYPARLNKELEELKKIALSRYPNSISQYQVDSLDLMPIRQQWRNTLNHAAKTKTFISPDDVEHISQLINTTDARSWVKRYLLTKKDPVTDFHRPGLPIWYPVCVGLMFLLICLIWVKFNRRILAIRLYGSPQFLRHIYQIAKQPERPLTFKPSKNLVINLIEAPERGHSLAMLLQLWLTQPNLLPAEFKHLFECCPLFTEIAQSVNQDQTDMLPNMKVCIDTDAELIHLQIWDIEISLEHPVHRAILLRLINHCKSLQIGGHLDKVTLYGGFHSLQRLCLKDSMLSNEWLNRHQLDRNEYFAWAECLMDFSVTVPEDLKRHLDAEFIRNEVNAFPMLAFIHDDLPEHTPPPRPVAFDFMRWITLQDWQKTHSEWASINFILLKAEALYRFKWESCSAAEKLALYYLVQNKRINPANVQMLEHLALNGLIVVKRGRLRIVNQSFAYFVKYAEDRETLTQLVDNGDTGKWRDYRMPITLMILLIIGGIALTSGNSLYMIVASVMGVLGTIGSLTNSASLIRNNLQK
ncbi:hypothetical protein [Neptunicella sp. SCSIO 80796]|uniref:hypothetical protein n=1 Tax=Neptunicella plasticusilytica TaxID=3117012 RepID=UPI003A4E1348